MKGFFDMPLVTSTMSLNKQKLTFVASDTRSHSMKILPCYNYRFLEFVVFNYADWLNHGVTNCFAQNLLLGLFQCLKSCLSS